jgi:hypothetical protein
MGLFLLYCTMKKTVLILFVFFAAVAYGQQSRTGSLLTHIDSLIVTMPSGVFGNQYHAPDARQMRIWDTVVSNVLSSNYSNAHTTADSLGYTLLDFLDTTQTPSKNYYILEKQQDSTNYWGTFVFNPDPLRQNLFIQAPHPLFDTKSGQQAIYAYKNTGARLYAVSGAHRCNHSDTSVCTGTTSVCGSSGKFQISDQPHNVNNTFFRSTVIAKNMITNLIVVQLHGFGKDSLDPDVILGNGTTRSPLITSTDYLIEFKNNLYSLDTTLTFKVAHVDTTWNRLTGTVNMQGRFLNGAPNPCTGSNASIPTPNGRFLHIEQVLWLRNTQAGKDKVKDALAMTFPVNPLPVSFITFTATKTANEQVLLQWSTASESNTEKFVVEMSYDNNIFIETGIVKAAGHTNAVMQYSFTQQIAAVHPVIYFRIRCMDYDHSFSNTKVAAVYNSSLSTIDLDVSPNPYVNEIRLRYTSETDEQVMVTITGMDGVVLHKQYFMVNRGENQLLIRPSQVKNGLAVLTVQRENGIIFNRKITKI